MNVIDMIIYLRLALMEGTLKKAPKTPVDGSPGEARCVLT